MNSESPRRKIGAGWGLAVFLVLGLASSVFAQFDKGQVSGFVRDQRGAVIPGASVKIANTLTRIERATKTDDSGYYVQPDLVPGDYEVSVEATGFKKYVQ